MNIHLKVPLSCFQGLLFWQLWLTFFFFCLYFERATSTSISSLPSSSQLAHSTI
ncbi:Hypothetical protein FKW44_009198 [Caligus rogercresseyi]|uniref:Uncharacterized protein n=1 Tax=Caligus rogercresseyi TaxID=217165 RepID=A0A7T8K8P9_CALRO|nr:Hypothetical protein FKW44_009198 [Caligus rogercresseyi]